MKKTLLFAALFSILGLNIQPLCAQNTDNPVIFEINGKKIYKSEFMKEFLRSVGKDPKAAPTACTYEKRQALDEYAELFVNYRTKLEDAYALKFDTLPDLIKELSGYRNELAAPYLIDSVTMNNILREAYQRNHYALQAAHILIRVDQNASAEDTLKAYNKAMECYKRAKAGENFYELAYENSEERVENNILPTDDPRRKNFGDLGTFSVFDMIYPFENAAYALNEGEISLPVRSQYGYHIIYLKNKIPYFGKCTIQHIWVSSKAYPYDAQNRANTAYQRLKNGESFNVVCQDLSDDKSSAGNGGLVSDLAMGQMPPAYIEQVSKMNPGEYTKPFSTDYGWHIVKLVRRDSIPSFEEMVPYYKQRLVRDERSNKPRESFIEQCKKQYKFVDYTNEFTTEKVKGKKVSTPMASLDECLSLLSDSVFAKNWHYRNGMVKDMRPLIRVGDMQYTAVDFLKFIEANQHFEPVSPLRNYMMDRYRNFINDKVFEYADKHLETEHAEFGDLMKEYRDGLMIFSYNDAMIWSKAIRDTVGLEAFYQVFSKQRDIDNEADAPYFWNERANIRVITFKDSASLAPGKARKIVEKAIEKGWNDMQLSNKLNSKIRKDASYRIEQLLVEKGHQNLLKDGQWRKGIYEEAMPMGYRIICVDEVLQPSLKSRSEARGYYINEYQNYLEKQLISELRKKYNVIVHQNVIDEIVY